jgi:hypothetical protein
MFLSYKYCETFYGVLRSQFLIILHIFICSVCTVIDSLMMTEHVPKHAATIRGFNKKVLLLTGVYCSRFPSCVLRALPILSL